MSEEFPLIRQYNSLKRDLPGGVTLFVCLGDFYEAFGEDATAAAPILGAVLTRRGGVPMCGFPRHSVDAYVAKMVRAGRSVALAERGDDGKWYITRLITPGTAGEGEAT